MKLQMKWLTLSVIVLLALGGCSTKNVMSTTEGVEGRKGGSGAPLGNEPLTGFSKKPSDEAVGGSGPTVMSKADPQGGQRRSREDGRQALADVYFAFDRWGLSEEGKKNLAQSADYLRSNPQAKVLIEGHCDERGSREYNLTLGEKRANETRSFLKDLGIRNPVAITSYGKERPVCEEREESCYSKNRRAHLLVQTEP
jgi:peptidoglycan-associated lipoprotein